MAGRSTPLLSFAACDRQTLVTYYADTSWWINFLLPEDVHHPAAIRLFDDDPDADVLWTPWQRVEVFNGLYQLERARDLPSGEARRVIRRLEMEVRLGYWPHVEFS
jgi:predicted nucleic acid-binding protein